MSPDIGTLVLLVVATGSAGFAAGLFGVGGGVALVPAYYALLLPQMSSAQAALKTAIATSLATILFSSACSFYSHWRASKVDSGLFLRFVPFVFIGAGVGGWLLAYVDTPILKIGFSFFLCAAALKTLQPASIKRPLRVAKAEWLKNLLGFATGLFSALLGIGGGLIGTLVLRLYGARLHRAIATASGFGFAIALPACMAAMLARPDESLDAMIGGIHAPYALCGAIAAFLTTPMGAKTTHLLSESVLKTSFALFLFAMSLLLWRG